MNYKYDAFISYRQVFPDSIIADKLHKLLEKYKVPKSLVKQGYPTKLQKVFKDVDELAMTSDLSRVIKNALKVSKFLIVICSTRTKESLWVNEEIKTFIELGQEDRILIVVLEGKNFEEVIPDILTKDKTPLVADIRAKSVKSSLKKLKSKKLKLIAPMIGCDYDDLVQRQAKSDRQFMIAFTSVFMIIAIIFVMLSISLIFTNKSLKETNKKLNQEILNTSAIYAQFLLTSQNDYTKWSKATSKLIDIISENNISRAIKANNILAKYISLKGYQAGKKIDVLPFLEEPKYFLKTLFFRNAKFTFGYIEDRYQTLFLLDDIAFPAKLFLFLSSDIKLPKIYQRVRSVLKSDLKRYGYFLAAMNEASKKDYKKAVELLDKAAKEGFYHSLTGSLSPFNLDSNYYFLTALDDKFFADLVDEKHRLMTKKEKYNLIKNINIFYLLSIYYALTPQKYLKVSYISDDYVVLWQRVQNLNYGRINYSNFVDYFSKKMAHTDNQEIQKLIFKLKHPKLSKAEKEEIKKYKKEQEELKDKFKTEIMNALKNSKVKMDYKKELSQKILDDKYSTTNNFLKFAYNKTKDLRDIDNMLSHLSKQSIMQIKKVFNIPKEIKNIKDIRIFISMQIRPYSFDLAMYNRFVNNKTVFNSLNELYKKEPNNDSIRFALYHYWLLKGDKKRADTYLNENLKNEFFKKIERAFIIK